MSTPAHLRPGAGIASTATRSTNKFGAGLRRSASYARPWLTTAMKTREEREAKGLRNLGAGPALLQIIAKTRAGSNKSTTDTKAASSHNQTLDHVTHPNLFLPVHQIMENRNKRRNLRICIHGCRFELIKRIALHVGFTIAEINEPWNVFWSDACLKIPELMDIRCQEGPSSVYYGPRSSGNYRRSNHFPGTNELCRKDALSRNAVRFASKFPGEFNFVPRTWNLPADKNDLFNFAKAFPGTTYICKPDCGAQGRGIFLTQNVSKLAESRQLVCQLYISNPLLLGGYKFDFRIYVQITSYEPLRVYIYNEGLARFATIPYKTPDWDNFTDTCMHLTNYAVNKKNENYNKSTNNGSKRKMTTVLACLANRGFDTQTLLKRIDKLIIKTILSSHTNVCHHYNSTFPRKDRGCYCFELLGFDILLDEHLKPWLLEVNLSPSFGVELQTDRDVKEPLLRDTLMMTYLGEKEDYVTIHPIRKQVDCYEITGARISEELQCQFKYEDDHKGNFRLIYPESDWRNYSHLFNQHLSKLYDPNGNFRPDRIKPKLKKKSKSLPPRKIQAQPSSKKKFKKLNKNSKTRSPSVALQITQLVDSYDAVKKTGKIIA